MGTDLSLSHSFLSAISSSDFYVFQTFSDKKPGGRDPLARVLTGSFSQHSKTLSDLNARGAGIFVQVNEGADRGKAHISNVRYLFVDTDGAPLGPIRDAMPRPHILTTSSPGRWHCLWRVNDESITGFKLSQALLAKRFGCDPSMTNVDRVLRVPGFINHKYNSPALVKCSISNHPQISCRTLVSAAQSGKILNGDSNQVATGLESMLPSSEVSHSLPISLDMDSTFILPDILAPGNRTQPLVQYVGHLVGKGLDEDMIRATIKRVNVERCPNNAIPIDDATLEREIFPAIPKFIAARNVNKVSTSVQPVLPVSDDISSGKADFEDIVIPEGKFRSSDKGNAERLIASFPNCMRFIHEQQKWLVWESGSRESTFGNTAKPGEAAPARGWVFDTSGEMIRRVWAMVPSMEFEVRDRCGKDEKALNAQLKTVRRLEAVGGAKSCIEAAQSCAGISISTGDLDGDDWLLGVSNGVVDLRTGKLRNSEPEDLITTRSHVVADATATCPRWEQFMLEIMDGDIETVKFLQRAVGYTLTGKTGEQAFFIMHGTGANGKSTFMRLMAMLLGDMGMATSTAAFIGAKPSAEDNYRFAGFRAARALFMSETNESGRLREELIKVATGEDKIEGRFPFGEFFSYAPKFKPWMSTNHKPTVYGTDHAMWRRLRLIPFEVTIPEEKRDKDLIKTLESESAGILNWAIKGCLEWQKTGLCEPESVIAATRAYQDESDELLRFMGDNCIVAKHMDIDPASVKVAGSVLYHTYSSWKKERNEKPMTQTLFGRKMSERGFNKGRADGAMYYIGIGLKGPQSAM